MQRTQNLNWLGTLAVAGVLAAGAAQAATLTINSGDVVWGSSGTGTARISYATYPDAYYLNNNTSSAWKSGYATGVYSESNAAWYNEAWSGTLFVCGAAQGSTPTVITWKIDTSGQLIQAMTIYNQTLVAKDGAETTTATWDWSINGTTWNNYVSLSSVGGDVADYSTHDLTNYLKGYSNFYIRTTLNHFNSETTPQIFRTNQSINYGLDINMVVPEPASLGLLALGGLFVLRRRRN